MLALPVLLTAIVGHGPDLNTIHAIALADAATLADIKPESRADTRPYLRYLSLHGVPDEQRHDFYLALLQALNGASIRGSFHRPKSIAGGRLLRLNLRELGWDRFSREIELDKLAGLGVNLKFKSDRDRQFYLDIWETMAFAEPFFVSDYEYGKKGKGWISPAAAAEAKRLCGTDKLVMSAHWLYPRLLLENQDGGFYSQLLVLPPTEGDLYKRLGVDIRFSDLDLRGKHGAAVIRSGGVAHNPREIQLLASSTGHDQHWLTRSKDVATVKDKTKDVLESPAGTVKNDATEIRFSLMNGLIGSYLANAQGVQQAFAPQQIAEDHRAPVESVYRSPTKTVVTPIKCYDCHSESGGLMAFDDAAIKLIVPERTDTGYVVKGVDKKQVSLTAIKIEEFYRAGLRDKIGLYRTSHEARVKDLTRLNAYDASRLLLKFYDRYTTVYVTQLVTPEQAAREMAMPFDDSTVKGARALWKTASVLYPDTAGPLGILAGGQAVHRLRWESSLAESLRLDVVPVKARAVK